MTDKIFQRTELGEAEIRQRNLPLSRAEQVVLLAIDGQLSYSQLQLEFVNDSSIEFEKVIEDLMKKELASPVKEKSSQVSSSGSIQTTSFEVPSSADDDFFSSSMDPMNSSSGLVVDTKTKSMRSVNLKNKKQESVYDVDIPLSLELDTKLRLKKDKRKSKLVQVFPEPEKPKKRRRSKRPVAPPASKWPMRIYIGLTAIGILLVLMAVAVKM